MFSWGITMVVSDLLSVFPDAEVAVRLRAAPVLRGEPAALSQRLTVLEDLGDAADADRLAALQADILALTA